VRILVDTNVFLEVLLQREKAAEAQALFSRVHEHDFLVSDYTLHSIGTYLFRRKAHETLARFIADMVLNASVQVIALAPEDLSGVVAAARRFGLDFDDAYQYATAEKNGLTLVSFDTDFDRTDRGRMTPGEAIQRGSSRG